MRGRLRRILIALIILTGVVALVYHSRHKVRLADFTWHRFIDSVSQANVPLLVVCLVGIYGCYAIRAVRWQRFCKYFGPTTFGNIYSGTLIGFASIFVLGRAGEPVRPLILARKDKLPLASQFGVYFLERVCDFSAAAVLACLALVVFPSRLSDAGADMNWVESHRSAGWLLLAGTIGVISLLAIYRLHGAAIVDRMLARWRDAGGFRSRFASALAGVSEGLQAIRTVSDLGNAVFYTAAHWTLVTLIYLGVVNAFPADFPKTQMNFWSAMLLLAITLVGSVLQLPGVGGGPQFASFVCLTQIFGVPPEPAVAIAMVLWIVTFAGVILVGIPLLIHEGVSFGELRNLARAEQEAEEAGKHASVNGKNGAAGTNATNGTEGAPRHANGKENLRGDSAR